MESEMEVIGIGHIIHENEKDSNSLPMVNECMLYWIIITNFKRHQLKMSTWYYTGNSSL